MLQCWGRGCCKIPSNPTGCAGCALLALHLLPVTGVQAISPHLIKSADRDGRRLREQRWLIWPCPVIRGSERDGVAQEERDQAEEAELHHLVHSL